MAERTVAQTAPLASTEGIAIDGFGNVYLADAPDHRVRKIEASGRITTLAGNGQPGASGDGGPAIAAQLNSPYGLAVDLAGNLYIADLGNARVRRITPAGVISTVAGGGAAEVSFFGAPSKGTDAKLNAPRNLAVDSAGQLYISDFGASRVYRLSTDGQISHLAGAATEGNAPDNATALTAPLKSPTALALDRAGLLYIADSGNTTIRRLQRGLLTRVTSTNGFSRDISFATITGLAIDATSGDLYVAEGRDSPVRRITPDSVPFVFAYGARDIALDPSGAVWFADGPFVRKLTKLGSEVVAGTGNFQFSGDGGPATDARLRTPSGVATDRAGNVYIADTANHRIRRVTPDGRIDTIAGTGEAGYGGDGNLALSAKLRSPQAVAVDAAGAVYIADTGNHAIRVINKAGLIDTFAGTGTAGTGNDNSAAKKVGLSRPQGLALDADGNLYVADTDNHRIGKITAAGWFTVVAGKGTSGNTGDGTFARTATLNRPSDVDFDAQGLLYILDAGNRRIRRLNAQGVITGFPSEGLLEPVALAWAGDGLYVADAGRHRVSLLSADGARLEISGTGEAGYGGDDGPANRGQLNRPVDVAVAKSGELLIADSENHRVRVVARAAALPAALQQPGVSSAVSAASLRSAAAVPGSLMTLFGQGLGPATGVLGRTDLLGKWATNVEGVEVQFDNIPAPLFYVQETQINLQVPKLVAGRARVTVNVLVNGNIRGTRALEVADTAPALFTGDNKQVAALNQDGGFNLPKNPAARGSIVSFFATGAGLWDIDLPDGAPALGVLPRPRQPVTLWVGGQVAELLYAGAAPGQVGLLQINARIPTKAIAGQAAVVLQIGDAASEVGPVVSIF